MKNVLVILLLFTQVIFKSHLLFAYEYKKSFDDDRVFNEIAEVLSWVNLTAETPVGVVFSNDIQVMKVRFKDQQIRYILTHNNFYKNVTALSVKADEKFIYFPKLVCTQEDSGHPHCSNPKIPKQLVDGNYSWDSEFRVPRLRTGSTVDQDSVVYRRIHQSDRTTDLSNSIIVASYSLGEVPENWPCSETTPLTINLETESITIGFFSVTSGGHRHYGGTPNVICYLGSNIKKRIVGIQKISPIELPPTIPNLPPRKGLLIDLSTNINKTFSQVIWNFLASHLPNSEIDFKATRSLMVGISCQSQESCTFYDQEKRVLPK